MVHFLHLLSDDPDVNKVPVMVDSSKFSVIEAGLKCLAGKGVVNSISLKEGEAKFRNRPGSCAAWERALSVWPSMRRDKPSPPITRSQSASGPLPAERSQSASLRRTIIFDANILTVGTGMEEHANYAVEFFDAVRRIKHECPGALTRAGVSNVSFSFRGNEVVREAMNAAFLYHAIQAGLDMGIVNAGQLRSTKRSTRSCWVISRMCCSTGTRMRPRS